MYYLNHICPYILGLNIKHVLLIFIIVAHNHGKIWKLLKTFLVKIWDLKILHHVLNYQEEKLQCYKLMISLIKLKYIKELNAYIEKKPHIKI
jgi:hypothetical protein